MVATISASCVITALVLWYRGLERVRQEPSIGEIIVTECTAQEQGPILIGLPHGGWLFNAFEVDKETGDCTEPVPTPQDAI